ncbi:MAG: hypothetical protein WBQ94_25980 [Terracidiphilus sp.]
MTTASTSRRPALLCSLILLICALATSPVVEIGMNDDWSSFKSAQVLAQTGHVVYNGYASPILGWLLFLGAFFIKLFGPSFTAARASVLLVAMVTAFITQRILVRTGINSRNATIGTIAMVLSPIFLPLALSFMSDVGALFSVVLCLYACLRALQTRSDHAVVAWLAFAALSNAVGGSVRQIAWLGVLVMFPCAIWLLRRRPHVLLIGGLLYAVSILIVFGTLHWFLQQPYSIPEPLFPGNTSVFQLHHLTLQFLSLLLSFALFLLPILIAFVPAVSLQNRRATALLSIGILIVIGTYTYLFLYHRLSLLTLIAPFRGFHVTRDGLAQTMPIKGMAPIVLTSSSRLFITITVLLALVCFATTLLTSRRPTTLPAQTFPAISQPISWPSLLILVLPFLLAYFALLVPRGLRTELFDRYLIVVFPVGLILLLRLYQDRVRTKLPLVAYAVALLFAIFAVAGTHDTFSLYRARLASVDELRAAGVPDTSIDAGLDHNGMAQISRYGHMNDPAIRMRASEYIVQTPVFPDNCQPDHGWQTPVLIPGYALSYDPAACGGPSRFPPVTYNNWLLGFRTVTIHIVDTVKATPPNTEPVATNKFERQSIDPP